VTEDYLRAVGESVRDLDVDRMLEARDSAEVTATIEEAAASAESDGISGTPAFLLGETGGELSALEVSSSGPRSSGPRSTSCSAGERPHAADRRRRARPGGRRHRRVSHLREVRGRDDRLLDRRLRDRAGVRVRRDPRVAGGRRRPRRVPGHPCHGSLRLRARARRRRSHSTERARLQRLPRLRADPGHRRRLPVVPGERRGHGPSRDGDRRPPAWQSARGGQG
jgi:hypothetical protein